MRERDKIESMNQKAASAGSHGFSQVILLGIVTILILAGAGGFLVFREKKMPTSQEITPPSVPNLTEPTSSQALPFSSTQLSDDDAFEVSPRTVAKPVPPKISPTPPLPPAIRKPVLAKKEAKTPVLKNLGVSFEPWDKNTNRAGAFIFLPAENKLFLEYGAEVPSSEGGTKILPTLEYRTAADADVFAAMDGIVTNITYEEITQDYSIHIQPELDSAWVLEHDHVSNLKVSKGDAVKAEDILGKAGTLGGELGRTEIMFWGPGLSSTRINTYCPFKYFAPELLSEYQQKALRHMKDWEEFKNNQNLYNEERHIFPGCAYETLLD